MYVDVVLYVRLDEAGYHSSAPPSNLERRVSSSSESNIEDVSRRVAPARSPWFKRNRKESEFFNAGNQVSKSKTAPETPSSLNRSTPVNSRFNTPVSGWRAPTEAQLAAITAAEIRKVKVQMPDDKQCLTADFFEVFMSNNDARQLVNFLDPSSELLSIRSLYSVCVC